MPSSKGQSSGSLPSLRDRDEGSRVPFFDDDPQPPRCLRVPVVIQIDGERSQQSAGFDSVATR
jgi:hypothetical protein